MNIFQFILEGFTMATNALRANKTRTLLTMLGVSTGIFAITIILTMVSSMKNSIAENLSALGNTTMYVHQWAWADEGKDWRYYINRPQVSYKEYLKLKQNLDNTEGISYTVSSPGNTLRAEGQSVSGVNIQAITEDQGIIGGFNFIEGRYFSDAEFRNGGNVCIVGYNIADGLFKNTNIVGKYLRAGGKRLRIVGVLKKVGADIFGNTDDELYIPYIIAPSMFNLSNRSVDKIIAVKAANTELAPAVESEIIGQMRASRGLKPHMENTFSINKLELIMKQVDSILGYLRTGGWLISFLSFLIGGFSIGLIMYISVRERTNQIGIQKALGATRAFILYQFLTESVLICILGGLLGLAFVYLVAFVVQLLIQQSGFPLTVKVYSNNVATAMILSIVIGLIAGFIPSMVAAIMDPVKAIRHK